MGSAEAIKRVSEIILSYDNYSSLNIVVSAFGGITDVLLEAISLAENSQPYQDILSQFSDRTLSITEALFPTEKFEAIRKDFSNLHKDLNQVLDGVSLVREATDKTKDYILSFGERCSAKMLALYLESIGASSSYIDRLFTAHSQVWLNMQSVMT